MKLLRVVFDLNTALVGGPDWSPQERAAFMEAVVYPAVRPSLWLFEAQTIADRVLYTAAVTHDDEMRILKHLAEHDKRAPILGVTIGREP